MTWLNNLYPEIKEYLLGKLPAYWPELLSIAQTRWPNANLLSPEIVIPLACCKAVGGDPRKAVPVAAGLMAVLHSVRILDDLQDKDKDGLWMQVGPARAFNYAFAFQTIGYSIIGDLPLPTKHRKAIYTIFNKGSFLTLHGQDRDLRNINATWDDYWKTAELKTSFITSSASAMGALAHSLSNNKIEACKAYGYHWGLCLQILNDMMGTWEPDGISDLEQGNVTLPLIYGLNVKHPDRKELQKVVKTETIAENADRIKNILDKIDTKSYLIWAALNERKLALKAIESFKENEGTQLLESYLTSMFGDIDFQLGYESKEPLFKSFHKIGLLKKYRDSDYVEETHQTSSTALQLRNSLRAS